LDTTLQKQVFDKLQQTDIASAMLNSAFLAGLPIAFWKLPHASHFYIVVSYSDQLHVKDPDIANLSPGFIVAPFDTSKSISYIKADLLYSSDAVFPVEDFKAATYGSEEAQNRKNFWEAWEKSMDAIKKKEKLFYHTKKVHAVNPSQSAYEALVEKGIEKIHHGTYQKIVYARNKAESKPTQFDISNTFLALCKQYPAAFVSMISLPETGTWLGASPETLIEVKDRKFFRTVALAGTQPKELYSKISEASWRQKEIEEQAMVSRYIINCFKKIRLREFEEIGPKTVAAGSLLHLKTDFKVNMEEVNFPQLGTVMLKLLHPTSAVCGMPQQETMKDIIANEHYDRELYSGFLGPVNIHDNTQIFVNLRCMQVTSNELVFYAGAGITEDSEPTKEFLETEMKMDVLRKFVSNQYK